MNALGLLRNVNLSPIQALFGNCLTGGVCLPKINFGFLRTREGMIKILEIVLGTVCQNLLINYSLAYSLTLGSSYKTFLAVCSSGIITSFLLLVTYMMSTRSFQLIRQSLFEMVFNGMISLFYILSSCYLAFAVNTFLYPIYKVMSLFRLYPEISTTYSIGFVTGIIHGYDFWMAYNIYKL